MDSLEAVQQAILVRLSSDGKEAVLFTQVQQDLHADGKLVAAALRSLLESRRVSLRRGSGADTQLYLSLANDLSESLSLVLDAVRASGTSGIDQAQLLSKLRLPKAELLKALQALLAQRHIREHRSYTNRAKRIYLLYHLEPSANITGGTFYCGEELDVALVDELRRRLVAYVEPRRSATLEQLVRFIEDESSMASPHDDDEHSNRRRRGGGGVVGSPVGSPITFIRASGGDAAMSFASSSSSSATAQHNNSSSSSSSMAPSAMTSKRISPRDVQTLVRTLVLDGVFERVSASSSSSLHRRPRARGYNNDDENDYHVVAGDDDKDDGSGGVYANDDDDTAAVLAAALRTSGSRSDASSLSALSPAALATSYRLSRGGCNVMRHFTAQPKRTRSGSGGDDGGSGDLQHHYDRDDLVDVAVHDVHDDDDTIAPPRRARKRDDVDNDGDDASTAAASSSSLFARERAARRRCMQLLYAEALWQPAAVSAHTTGARAGQWSYMPAIGFPCLGCPLLARCSSSGKGVVSPAHCAYLAEWLA